ncbi:MAG: SAM-dependent methyltransferase [Nanoarchaeota archaeon]|nr:MAG: SAM-dependent methyltransferase [Nanoarchaeota archaeon]
MALWSLQKEIYRILAGLRWKAIKPWLNSSYKTLLDVGGSDYSIKKTLTAQFKVTTCDIKPKKGIIKQDVQKLTFKNNSFDIVTCFEVLEHVPDPVRAMKELQRVSKHRLLISVPNDPWFTFTRLGIWEKEHFWSIKPNTIKLHLGKPIYEKNIIFGRYYFAVFEKTRRIQQ